ncbi:FMN-binding negative transcriptional regulator [Sphingomonas sp. BLCC-B65]|nr:FMN-binding negative transcriptional regulator [Sphingomonas sp. BLCC-B65]
MRDNPDYAMSEEGRVREFLRRNPWCTLVSFVPGRGLVASHCPVVLVEGADGIVLESHLGRPDEVKHELGRHEVLAIVQSAANGYVSPGWYGTSPAVPTWNYSVVHAHGTPEILPHEENLAALERLVDHFEGRMPVPHPMNATPADSAYARRIAHGTVGFRLRLTRLEGKEKMSQDKPVEIVDRVIDALEAEGPYGNHGLAEYMMRMRDGRTLA